MESANEMKLIFESRSINESFARVTVAAFMTSLNPTVEEVSDVKTCLLYTSSRAAVFNNIGFDSYTSKEFMNILQLTENGWAKDDILIQHIMEAMDTTEQQDFVFGVSVPVSYTHLNAPGNDMRFYNERVEASRNFANKVWNASRFITVSYTHLGMVH